MSLSLSYRSASGKASDLLRTRGIDRTEFLVLHDKQDRIEDCRFVWNEQGYLLGCSAGLSHLRNTQFIGSDPVRGGLGKPGGFLVVAGVNLVPIKTEKGARYVVVGAPPPRRLYTKGEAGGE